MGTGDWTLRCSPASSKNSWNKRSIYKLLKYRTKNSHNKYKLQAIIEVIKWYFYVSSPRLPPKILKGLRGFLMTKVKSAAQKPAPAKTPWGCYQPAPGLWQRSCCHLASYRTRLKARLFILWTWIRANWGVGQKTGEKNCFRTQVAKFLSCFKKVPHFPKRKH